MKTKSKIYLNNKRHIFFLVVLISIIIVITSIWFYRFRKEQILQAQELNLSIISILKAKHIQTWYKEEIEDGFEISRHPFLLETIKQFSQTNSAQNRIKLKSYLSQIKVEHEYFDVLLTSINGDVIVSSNEQVTVLKDVELKGVEKAINKGDIIAVGINRHKIEGKDLILFSIVAPLMEGEHITGTIIFRIDPKGTLYPIIDEWPNANITHETIILSIEADSIYYLKKLKHKNGESLITSLPIEQASEISIRVARGNTGVIRGRDYRNVDVTSYAIKIEGTPWHVFSKVDIEEMLNSLPLLLAAIVGVVITGISLTILAVSLLYNQRQKTIYRQLYISESEKRQQELKILESENRYREFFENDLTGDYFASADGTILNCNPAFANMFGYDSANDIIGKNVTGLYQSAQDREAFLTCIEEEKSLKGYEVKLKRNDGVQLWCVENIVGQFDDDGKLLHYYGYIFDNTGQKLAEAELKHQSRMEEILRRIASKYINVPISTVASSIQESLAEIGLFIKADRVYIFDYDLGNNTCSNTYEWCDTGIEPQIQELQDVSLDYIPHWVETHRHGKIMKIPDVFALPESDGVRQILEPQQIKSLITIPIMNANECTGFVGFDYVRRHYEITKKEESLLFVFAQVLTNIQSRIVLEKDLIISKEKAEESDKLKTAFINNISHEIRTPLNGILGFGQILAEEKLSVDERMKMFKHLQHSSNRLLNTITDYIDMARIFSGTMYTFMFRREFSLKPFFVEIADSKRHLCVLNKVDFEINVPQNQAVIVLVSDREFIRRIISILLDNALKFTKEGSIECGYSVIPGFIEFYVNDTGAGIGTDKLKYIFEMFTQGETVDTRGYDGSGLGLTIAMGMVELLGGKMKVASKIGKGSEFTFTVPYDSEIVAGNEKIATEKSTNPKKRHKPLLLIAEDDELNYLYIEEILKKAGLNYLLAVNGLEAVEICKHNKNISLVLMDIKMPEMNGLEATKLIREFRPDLPIIATTAYNQIGDEQLFLAAGCNAYLAKPISYENLYKLVRKYT